MELLDESQLETVTGGGVWLWLGIVGFIIFIFQKLELYK